MGGMPLKEEPRTAAFRKAVWERRKLIVAIRDKTSLRDEDIQLLIRPYSHAQYEAGVIRGREDAAKEHQSRDVRGRRIVGLILVVNVIVAAVALFRITM